MAESVPGGAVVLPAYLVSEEDVRALHRTLADLPACAAVRVVVLQPGPRGMPDLALLDDFTDVRRVVLDRGVGKWPAFAEGFRTFEAAEVAWVGVVDADGAFPGTSVAGLAGHLVQRRLDHAIGSRRPAAIDLRAMDEASPSQRLHAEAFFNTLTLLAADRIEDPSLRGSDLQCGLHVFTPARARSMAETVLPFYGGELHCFYESVSGGAALGFAPVEVAENPVSAYRFDEIARELLALPFLARLTRAERVEAFRRSQDLYADWPLRPDTFASDLRAVVTP